MLMRREKDKQKRGTVSNYVVVLLVIMLLATVTGCGAMPRNYAGSDRAYDKAMAPAAVPAPSAPTSNMSMQQEMTEDSGRGTAYAAAEEVPPGTGQRFIIQNAHLHLEIRDIDETVAALQELTDKAGGYVASREIYNVSEERRAGNVSLRVPADRFSALLSGIRDLGKMKNERVYTDDVTMQYIDLEARIANLAAQEKRLRELLEKAESIEDIMQVERELGRIRGDLEAMEGNFRYLRERVQYSTLDIRLVERDVRTLVVDDKFGGFGERLLNLLALNTNRFLEGFTGFVIVAIGSLPIIVPLLIIAILIWKSAAAIKRKRVRRNEQQQSEQHNQSQ